MRVILVDNLITANKYGSVGCESSQLFVELEYVSNNISKFERVSVLSDEDLARKELVSKLLRRDVTALMIKLLPNLDNRTVAVRVMPSLPSGSILGSLVQRFDENVKVSLFLKGHHYVQDFRPTALLDFASVEGMTLGAESYACTGVSADATPFSFDLKGTMHVKLVADITFACNILKVPEKVPLVQRVLEKGIPFSQKVLEKESFSDVIISAGNGVEIEAHNLFLSVSSPVLEAMFATEMKETQTGRVDMSDLSEEAVRAFLRYIYYEDLKEPKENTEVARELLYAGHKYDVRSLEAEMIEILLEKTNDDISVELAFKVYMFTRNIDSAVEMKIKAIQIMKAKLDELEKLQEYNDLFEKPCNSKAAKELCRDFAEATLS